MKLKSSKEPGPHFKCGGPHFQNMSKNKCHSNNMLQNYKKAHNSHKFNENTHNSSQFPTLTLSFQASQQVQPGGDISLSVNTIKHFLSKLSEKYTLQKKSTTPSDPAKSQNVTVNEIVEIVTMTDDKK